MLKHSEAKIFLADQRGISETPACRSRQTFNFGHFFHEHKMAFGDLYAMNDDELAGGGSLESQVQENSLIVLLPLAGAVMYSDDNEQRTLLAAGQVLVVPAHRGMQFTITNAFRNEPANVLQIWFRSDNEIDSTAPEPITFTDVNSQINTLMPIPEMKATDPGLPFFLYIGKFNGRGETSFTPQPGESTFVFIIEGAFEVEGRLLHARDGLGFRNSETLEIEALSNDALMLVSCSRKCAKEAKTQSLYSASLHQISG